MNFQKRMSHKMVVNALVAVVIVGLLWSVLDSVAVPVTLTETSKPRPAAPVACPSPQQSVLDMLWKLVPPLP